MSDRLDGGPALERYLRRKAIPFTRSPDGRMRVPIDLAGGVATMAELRWVKGRQAFECVTPLPLPVGRQNREAVASALAAANRTLGAETFVVVDGAIHHVASTNLDPDGSLAANEVDRAIASIREGCDAYLPDLFRAAVTDGPDEPDEPDEEDEEDPPATSVGEVLDELRLEVEARRPTFARRLDRSVLIDEVANPWFRQHRILFVQSPSPMPAIGIVVCLAPSGRVRVLAGQVTALNEVARAERIELTDDKDARAYANVVTSWTRAADFPEMPVDSFDAIPFRPDLTETERSRIQRLRAEVTGRLAPLSFVRAGDGWRLDVWLVSVSRLIHRTADLRADGTLDVGDDIVATELPIPPGRVWDMVDGRLLPVG